ncbi:MAG: hypothetical protein AB7O24_29405 [Kofleriaceae bacterium]
MPNLRLTSSVVIAAALGISSSAAAQPAKKKPSVQQEEADRLFKSGVALFKEAKFAEALAEFERAYEISPHPLVLYNIAGCHRELSNYTEAVKFYTRFLSEGKGKVPAARLNTAQTELNGILARIARVTVTISPEDGAVLFLDGKQLGTLLEMPLMLPPGEHTFVAKSPGRKDAERTLRVASGDEVTIDLTLPELPPETAPIAVAERSPLSPPSRTRLSRKRFAVGIGFGTNLRQVADTGAPSFGVGVNLGSRIELGIDAVLVATAVVPSVRVRLAGDVFSIHAVAAMPIAIGDEGPMSETFVAGAGGLGVRYRPMASFAVKLESFVSVAGEAHGTTIPTFLGGELWF